MSAPKNGSVTQQFRKRADKVAHISDAAYYADMAGRYYAKDKITRLEAQMMIDAAVGSPWALFMAWCRHTLRTVTGARKAMEARFRSEQNEQRAIAEDVAEQLDPATNESAIEAAELEVMDEVPEQARVAMEAGCNAIEEGLRQRIVHPDDNQAPSRIIRATR